MRECVFRALLAAGVWLPRGQPTKPTSRASVPRSGPCAAYTFRALQTHFQVSAALPVGKEASGVYQHHSGMPCWGHLAEGTWHFPWAPSEEWQVEPWLVKN